MNTYIALLRGINVGGRNKLPMKDLVSILEHLGYEDVRTYIQSGNEEFKLIGKVCYLYAPNGVGRSKLAAAVEESIGVPVTARNWNTVSNIVSMAERT